MVIGLQSLVVSVELYNLLHALLYYYAFITMHYHRLSAHFIYSVVNDGLLICWNNKLYRALDGSAM